MKSSPVLQAPDFCSQSKLAVDASDAAAGAVLLQEGNDGIDHPICYFSRKFNKNQRTYSTVFDELDYPITMDEIELKRGKSHGDDCISNEYLIEFKVRGPFVQTLCIEKDSYMDAI